MIILFIISLSRAKEAGIDGWELDRLVYGTQIIPRSLNE